VEETIAERRQRLSEQADRELAEAYREYSLEELRRDWKCSLSERSREILKAELVRRKVPMDYFDTLGRGVRRR
jgi:hypothetical protein